MCKDNPVTRVMAWKAAVSTFSGKEHGQGRERQQGWCMASAYWTDTYISLDLKLYNLFLC